MKRALRYGIITGIVLIIAVIVGLVLAWRGGQLLNVLYLVLMILAFLALLATTLLIYAIMKLIQTILLVREEMRPLLNSVQDTVEVAKETVEAVKETAQHAGKTAGTLAGTVKLTRDYAISPSIRAAALVLASRQMVRIFMGKGHTRTRAEERKRKQMEMLEAEMVENAGGGE